MTTLLLHGSGVLASLALGLRFWIARVGHLIDRAVSARAARAVPEWQMRKIETEIRRYVRGARRHKAEACSARFCTVLPGGDDNLPA